MRIQPNLTFRKTFRWEGEIEDFIRSRVQGHSLNVPCGESRIGDVRVDLDTKAGGTSNDWVGGTFARHPPVDMLHLPFASQMFDTVITDPPWKIDIFKRPRQFFEVHRVCKIGGRILMNSTWVPSSKYDVLQIEELFIRQSVKWGNTSLLMTIRKTGEVPGVTVL